MNFVSIIHREGSARSELHPMQSLVKGVVRNVPVAVERVLKIVDHEEHQQEQ